VATNRNKRRPGTHNVGVRGITHLLSPA
jgi:hypothetical protein